MFINPLILAHSLINYDGFKTTTGLLFVGLKFYRTLFLVLHIVNLDPDFLEIQILTLFEAPKLLDFFLNNCFKGHLILHSIILV